MLSVHRTMGAVIPTSKSATARLIKIKYVRFRWNVRVQKTKMVNAFPMMMMVASSVIAMNAITVEVSMLVFFLSSVANNKTVNVSFRLYSE